MKNRKERKDASMAESMIDADDFKPKQVAGGDDNNDDDDDDSKDDENQDDSNFTNDIEKIINYSDMDQSFKGENIDFIGQIEALGKKKKNDLKERNYADLEGAIDPAQDNKKTNKFFQAKQEERERNERRRKDKHLLPQEKKMFKDPATGKVVKDEFTKLPFQSIDIIFNHKNVWANLQNPNPAVIFYHIHDETKWMPLVSEPYIKHPLVKQRE